jgi:eukaryotic-like serine/threonine-protein kinase
MEDPAFALRPGSRLDRYELLCPIASGGMAQVWLARLRGKRGFEKLFAIKTVKSDLTEDPRFQEMFLDEAKIASAIQHPNVAQIIDLGELNNVLYLVMEWVDGESLAKVRRLAATRGHPLPLEISLRIIADACKGLHAAHELHVRGQELAVVHRDVSPQNILVSTAGTVKVIDFGVAKAKNRGSGETGTGIVKGKIHYMAPEQVLSKPLDRRVDVWAIGVCLHQLVLGTMLWDTEEELEVLRRLMHEPPPARAKGAVPEPIEEILSKCLAREPAERYPTAAAVERAIERALDKLGFQPTNDDVAEFLKTHLSDLATVRNEIVTRAIEEADARQNDKPTSAGGVRVLADASVKDDAAFAPTIVSQKTPQVQAPAATPSAPRRLTLALDEANETPGSTEIVTGDVAGLPKRRGWVWVLLLLGGAGAAWYRWPDAPARIRALLSPPTPELPVAPPALPSNSGQPVPPPPDTSSPSLSAVAATSSVPSLASHRVEPGLGHLPAPSSLHVAAGTAPPPGHSASASPPPPASVSAQPSAAPSPPSPPASSAASAPVTSPPPPAPSSSEDDKNPYP